VDWLEKQMAMSREEAVVVMMSLMQRGFVCHVTNSRAFEDNAAFYYYYVPVLPEQTTSGLVEVIVKEGVLRQKVCALDPPNQPASSVVQHLIATPTNNTHTQTFVVQSTMRYRRVCSVGASEFVHCISVHPSYEYASGLPCHLSAIFLLGKPLTNPPCILCLTVVGY
jgi:hypothetical protein